MYGVAARIIKKRNLGEFNKKSNVSSNLSQDKKDEFIMAISTASHK